MPLHNVKLHSSWYEKNERLCIFSQPWVYFLGISILVVIPDLRRISHYAVIYGKYYINNILKTTLTSTYYWQKMQEFEEIT